MDDNSVIPETFKGKTVLITGATGFLGKVLLEKLLRCCPGISEVLVLLRPGTLSSQTILDELKSSKAFDSIRINNPQVLEKMRFIDGDIRSENMGLNKSTLQKIAEDVSFVFHCTMIGQFGDTHKELLIGNLVVVQNVLEVCHTIKKLEGFVHVSTAYSFCNQVIISEELYPEKVSPSHILEDLKWMTEDQLQMVCEGVLQGRPLLYFSNAMAEIYLEENCGDIPTVIVRPSILTASLKDPFPGWIDKECGPCGFISLNNLGFHRTLLVDRNVNANWVPVDIVANTLIRAAHVISTERKTGEEILLPSASSGIPIINCVCPEQNTIKWFDAMQLCMRLNRKYPVEFFFRTPGKGIVTSSLVVHTVYKYFAHYLPAVVIDLIFFLLRKEMCLVSIYQGIDMIMSILHFYTSQSFFFTSPNMKRLVQQMNPANCNNFLIDQNRLNWPDYLDDYVHGVRKYILNESDSSLESSRKHLERYVRIFTTLKITSVGLLFLLYLLYHRYVNPNPRIRSPNKFVGIFSLFSKIT